MLLNAVGQAYQVNIPSRPAAAERCCPATSGEYSLSQPVAAERRWPVISGENYLPRLDRLMNTLGLQWMESHTTAAMTVIMHSYLGTMTSHLHQHQMVINLELRWIGKVVYIAGC